MKSGYCAHQSAKYPKVGKSGRERERVQESEQWYRMEHFANAPTYSLIHLYKYNGNRFPFDERNKKKRREILYFIRIS